METQQFAWDDFDFPEDLTFDQMLEATPEKATTQEEVRKAFYDQVVVPHVEKMFGWVETKADTAVKAMFNKVLKDFFMSPTTYISELETFAHGGQKVVFGEPTVLSHFIYSGIKTPFQEEESHNTICYASHFTTNNTNRCIDPSWHTHDLVAMPIALNPKTRVYAIREDTRVRLRHRHFISTFRRKCKSCVRLSSSVDRSRQLQCTDGNGCKRYVKFNGKWNIDAICNAIRYILRRKLEGVGQRRRRRR